MLKTLVDRDRDTLLRLTRILVFASVLLAILMPFSAPLLVGGAFVLQAFWHFRDHGTWGLDLDWRKAARNALPVAALVAYFAMRLFPGPSTLDAMIGVISMGVYAALTALTLRLQAHQNLDVQRAIAKSFLAAFFLGASVHAFEVITGFAGRRLLWTLVPPLRPRAGKLVMEGETVAGIVVFIANHVSAILTALIVPVAMLAARGAAVGLSRAQTGAAWASIAIATAAVMLSDHATSKLALLVMALSWVTLRTIPRITGALVAASWTGAVLLVLPVALFAYHAEAYRLPKAFSAQHRIVIWGVTAERTLQAPFLGIGMGQTEQRDESQSPTVAYVPGTRLPIATGRHAHNMFLQTWHEAGAFGAILLLLAGLPIVAWIARAPVDVRPSVGAAFLGTITAASMSYGLLAAWYLATFAATILFCRFAGNFYAEGDGAS